MSLALPKPQYRLSLNYLLLILIAVALSLMPLAGLCQVGELPIFAAIIATIEANKVPMAIVGIMIIGASFLAKPLAPEWSAQNRGMITTMLFGGILVTGAATIAPMLFAA